MDSESDATGQALGVEFVRQRVSETVEKAAGESESGEPRECETSVQPERSVGSFTVNRWMLKKRWARIGQ